MDKGNKRKPNQSILSDQIFLSFNFDNKEKKYIQTEKKKTLLGQFSFSVIFFLVLLAESTICNQEHILD